MFTSAYSSDLRSWRPPRSGEPGSNNLRSAPLARVLAQQLDHVVLVARVADVDLACFGEVIQLGARHLVQLAVRGEQLTLERLGGRRATRRPLVRIVRVVAHVKVQVNG